MPTENTPIDFDNMTDEELDNFDITTLDSVDAVVESQGKDDSEATTTDLVTDPTNTEVDKDVTTSEGDTETTTDNNPYGDEYLSMLQGVEFQGAKVTLDSPEQVKSLIEKGLGSNRRMQELQPKLKTLAMLEEHDLLDQNKLSYLIALSKNDPDAIKKLVQESKIDVLELSNDDSTTKYTPKDYSVNPQDFALKQVEAELQSSPKYADTLQSIQAFDDASKLQIQENPEHLRTFVSHHEHGVYDEISQIVNSEVAKGNLNGQNFVQDYNTVWAGIQEQLAGSQGVDEAAHKDNPVQDGNAEAGAVSPHEASTIASTTRTGSSTNPVTKTSSPSSVSSTAARNAANSSSGTTVHSDKTVAKTIDYDSLSDEEFSKLDITKLQF